MKLCCDENIKRSVTALLAQEGHDVVRVQDEFELGSEDRALIEFCRDRDRVLLTNDDDFFSFDDHPGVLFLTSQQTPPRDVATALRRIDRQVPDPADRVWHVPDGWL